MPAEGVYGLTAQRHGSPGKTSSSCDGSPGEPAAVDADVTEAAQNVSRTDSVQVSHCSEGRASP